jgi:hypothetical protein
MIKTLDEKIALVKEELLKNHPDCPYTIKILLWDDGTDLVQAQYGDEDNLYIAKYYDEQLNYLIEPHLSGIIKEDGKGNKLYVVTEEEFYDKYSVEIPNISGNKDKIAINDIYPKIENNTATLEEYVTFETIVDKFREEPVFSILTNYGYVSWEGFLEHRNSELNYEQKRIVEAQIVGQLIGEALAILIKQ